MTYKTLWQSLTRCPPLQNYLPHRSRSLYQICWCSLLYTSVNCRARSLVGLYTIYNYRRGYRALVCHVVIFIRIKWWLHNCHSMGFYYKKTCRLYIVFSLYIPLTEIYAMLYLYIYKFYNLSATRFINFFLYSFNAKTISNYTAFAKWNKVYLSKSPYGRQRPIQCCWFQCHLIFLLWFFIDWVCKLITKCIKYLPLKA